MSVVSADEEHLPLLALALDDEDRSGAAEGAACQRRRALNTFSSASESYPKISTLALKQSSTSFSPGLYRVRCPPSTATPPLTAQHGWCARPRTRSDIRSQRSSPRSSLHTALVTAPSRPSPPHSTSPGRVRSHTFAPSRAATYTPVSRHAPTSPLFSATRAHNSGRATAREMAHLAAARVVGAILM
jgi:hypothetical protein